VVLVWKDHSKAPFAARFGDYVSVCLFITVRVYLDKSKYFIL